MFRRIPADSPENSAFAWRRRLLRVTIGLVAGVLLILPGPRHAISAEAYLLGPQDKIRLKIYEWRPSRDVIFEWTALNDNFIVGADGKVSLPFAGNVEASGLSPEALAGKIAESLKKNMGLGRAPDVSVEVTQFRPFYIVGKVTQPGEFPFRPGLTVLQALSIAGGLKTIESKTERFEREIIAGKGDVARFRLTKINLLAKKARLEAEQANAPAITFPQALMQNANDELVAAAMQQENAIFETRRKGQETQLQALTELRDFLEKEQESLNGHLAFQDRQIELYQKDMDGIAALVKKGFATESRQTALERALVQARSDRLTAETSLLRARQEMSRTELSMLDLKNRYEDEVRATLRDTQAQLEDVDSKARTASELLYDSELSAPRLAAKNRETAQAKPVFTIVRQTSRGPVDLDAEENTTLQPGDTVKVEIPFGSNSDGSDFFGTDPAGTSAIGADSARPQSAQ